MWLINLFAKSLITKKSLYRYYIRGRSNTYYNTTDTKTIYGNNIKTNNLKIIPEICSDQSEHSLEDHWTIHFHTTPTVPMDRPIHANIYYWFAATIYAISFGIKHPKND